MATVKDSSFFFSSKSAKGIPMGATDSIKVPRMMPNTEATKMFENANQGMGNASKVAMVSNFAVNLILQGSMSLLWGLLHSMQIVAHFPLINIAMPANADAMFQVLIEITTFGLIPTEDFLEDIQKDAGLANDSFILTDNFESYGFESTGPIRNL